MTTDQLERDLKTFAEPQAEDELLRGAIRRKSPETWISVISKASTNSSGIKEEGLTLCVLRVRSAID